MENSANPSEFEVLIQSGYRYAFSLTHHQHDAEDLIQQACLKVLKTRGDLVSKHYLFRAIRNLFYDGQRRRPEFPLSDELLDQLVDPAADPEAKISQRSEIHRLLCDLKPAEREALYLNTVEGYTAAEITELTGQPRGTVLSHIARAKKKVLRKPSSLDRAKVS